MSRRRSRPRPALYGVAGAPGRGRCLSACQILPLALDPTICSQRMEIAFQALHGQHPNIGAQRLVRVGPPNCCLCAACTTVYPPVGGKLSSKFDNDLSPGGRPARPLTGRSQRLRQTVFQREKRLAVAVSRRPECRDLASISPATASISAWFCDLRHIRLAHRLNYKNKSPR